MASNIILLDILKTLEGTNASNIVDINTYNGTLVYSDTNPTPTKDTVRGGWNFSKLITGTDKFNYYMYGNQINNPIQINELHNFWVVVNIDNITTSNTVPFLNLYTMPTEAPPAWYGSVISYSIDFNKHDLFNGEKVLLYSGTIPPLFDKLRKIPLTNKNIMAGDPQPTDIINLLSVHSHSVAPINTSYTVHNMGWSTKDVKYNLKLN